MLIIRILHRLLNIVKGNSYRNTSGPEGREIKYEREVTAKELKTTFEFEYTDESFPLFI